jgi:predicted HAD superfamily Cof-like phosphohydrolase
MSNLADIVQFNVTRGLVTFKGEAEYTMLTEELNELKLALDTLNEYEMVDALCDLIVVATGAIYKLGYDPDEALGETVREINSRRGTFNEATGKWQKDPDQDPETLYKANYFKMR